jgi:ubiquinone biosynthesis monooxygenase Coq7
MTSLSLAALPIDKELLAELRSDHAGEYGAVAIYQGILAATRSPEVRRFAQTHLASETRHLAFMERLLPRPWQTRLLPLWKVSGWLLGALPALLGPRAVYLTIEAVEQFVEGHYQHQLAMLAGNPALQELGTELAQCCADEVAHKLDAAARSGQPPGPLGRLWMRVVDRGSAAAVALAKRL